MGDLIIPAEYAAQAARHTAGDELIDQHRETYERFNPELRRIDPYLDLVYIGDRVPVGALPGVVPGAWHVRRRNPLTVPTFKAIVGPKGEPIEPTARIFEQLKEMDGWKTDPKRALKDRLAREAADRERRVDEMRAEAREEFAMRMKAELSPSISFGGRNWTARARGRRG